MRRWQAIALFCEDVRQEKSGHTLLGLFPDNLNVPEFPGALSKLGIYVRVNIDPQSTIKSVRAKLCSADGSEQDLGGFQEEKLADVQRSVIEKGGPIAGLLIFAVAQNYPLPAPGRHTVIVTVDDESEICGTINIQPIPSSTSPEQQPEQSRDAAPASS